MEFAKGFLKHFAISFSF